MFQWFRNWNKKVEQTTWEAGGQMPRRSTEWVKEHANLVQAIYVEAYEDPEHAGVIHHIWEGGSPAGIKLVNVDISYSKRAKTISVVLPEVWERQN